MRKILVAFDGSVYAEGALDFAQRVADKSTDQITGVFIEDLSYLNYINVFGEEYLPMDFEVINELKEDAATKVKENIQHFEQACKKGKWKYDVHYNKGVPAYELIRESRFADLIVIGYQTFFSNVENMDEQDLLKDLLSDAECPVIAVPEKQHKTENIVLTYDGKSSSFFAIKQFAYLLPSLAAKKKTYCLTVTGKGEQELPELSKEYLTFHFPEIRFEQSPGEPDETIIQYTQQLENPLLIMGAYGRNIFSRFFSSSVAERIIKQQTIPIFIAHR